DAVVIGGGFIGLETAVALADMWGIHVSVVEMTDYLMSSVLPESFGLTAETDCVKHGIDVYTKEKTLKLEGKDDTVFRVVTDKRTIPAQLVLFAAGFQPNNILAKDAGLELGPKGAIVVDEYMRTSDPDIYAGGDCASIKNIITGKQGYLPLGSMANRQGRVIGSNLAGLKETFPGYVGTWCVKLFDFSIAATGLTINQARQAGFDAISVCAEQLDRAHFYPEKEMMALELVVEKTTRQVLGIQGASKNGQGLKARIDAVAALLQYGKPKVSDISNLEVGYAPPFAAAMDVLNTVGNVTDNVLSGRFTPITAKEFIELWQNRDSEQIFFLDARPARASKAMEAAHPEWHAIPLEEIAQRINEIPKDHKIAIICNTGLRSYDSLLIMAKHGITNVVNTLGGMQSVFQMGIDKNLK
ncbi:MAG: FAD-dependent oxidoreductase, partial [Desulfovibrio sp.]|nr:FAD-dependent oxidoreductase [Desulfovibrio sp.]